MNKQWVVGLVAGMILVPTGLAQKKVSELQKALKGKQMVLRNYAAVPVATYTWDNGVLNAEPVKVQTFGEFTTKSVKQKGGTLIFEGKRATLVRNTKTNEMKPQDETPMRLEVDLHGANLSTVLPVLQGMMFFPDMQAALVGLPPQIATTLDISPESKTNCKCNWIFDGSKWMRVDATSPLILPKLLYSVEPEFSEEARRKKVAGSVAMILYVSETGQVGNIWLTTSVGYDMDENAEKVVRQYVFKPATYDGKPVATMLRVEVNFQVF